MFHASRTHIPPNRGLSEEAFTRFHNLIATRTGLYFGPRRRETFSSTILAAASRAGCTSLDEYFLSLQIAPTDSDLWDDLIPRLTVGETYFFRDPGLMAALREHILPQLIDRHGTDHSLRLWSAGCATGEEPYTLTILLRQLLPDIEHWRVSILATDINRQALSQAAAGRYRSWSFRQTDAISREQYFTQQDNCFEIDPLLRALVTFGYLNLAEPTYPAATNQTDMLDLIMWRNVSLYLPEKVTREVVDRLYNCLSPGGWLVVGPSETNADVYSKFQSVRFDDAFVYRKTLEPGSSLLHSSLFASGCRKLPDASPENDLSLRDGGTYSHAQGGERWRRSGCTPAPPLLQKPAIQAREKCLQTRSGMEMQDYYQKGLVWLQKKRYSEAMQCFLSYLEHNPEDAAACHQVARLHANGGRLSAAQKWAEQALEYNPLLEEAHYTLALIQQERGELEAAIPRLKKALYLKPDFILAHISLADFYQQLGRSADAARHRTQAIRLASRLAPDTVLPGSDDLKAGNLLARV